MKLWIARSDDGFLTLHKQQPTWIESFGWTSVSMVMNSEKFPEVTFENSPMQVELTLLNKNSNE